MRDPVCGMRIDPREARARASFHGETYWFCSVECRERFEEDPERYQARFGGAELTSPEE